MFVFASDTHLAHHAWASMPQVCGDAYDSYQQIIDWCVANKPTALILGGDIFDHVPTPEDVRVFLNGIDRLRNAKIRVLAIQGQHGRYRDLSWTSIIDWVEDLEKASATVDGHLIAGIDNRPPEELKSEILHKCTPDVGVLVLHQLCRGTVQDRDGHQAWDFDPEDVPDTVQLVLMGDFHQEWETQRVTKQGVCVPVVYNGSTCMQSVSEPYQKSFLVVNNDLSYRRIPLRTRYFETIRLQEPNSGGTEQLKAAALRLKELPVGSLVQIRFDPRLPEVESTLATISPKIHLMFRPYSVELELNSRNLEGHSTTLESCLDQVIDRTKEPQFHSFMLDLLRSKDLNQTITSHRDSMLSSKGAT